MDDNEHVERLSQRRNELVQALLQYRTQPADRKIGVLCEVSMESHLPEIRAYSQILLRLEQSEVPAHYLESIEVIRVNAETMIAILIATRGKGRVQGSRYGLQPEFEESIIREVASYHNISAEKQLEFLLDKLNTYLQPIRSAAKQLVEMSKDADDLSEKYQGFLRIIEVKAETIADIIKVLRGLDSVERDLNR